MPNLSRLSRPLRWAALLGVVAAASGCAVYPAYPGYGEPVAMGPAPGVVYGAPVYGPAPVYVAPPPVYYGPPPVSLNLGLGFGGYRHYGGGGRHYYRGRR
jgi:hypothetical protein